jgi:ribonuclease Z
MASRLNPITLEGIKFVGFSLAGEETVVGLPELNVCFDVGRAPREIIALDHVLLSHGHMDHAAGLAYYFSQRAFVGAAPGTMLMPTALVKAAKAIMAGWAAMEGHPSPANIVGLEPGQDYTLRKGLLVRPFAVNHGCPSLGFSLIDLRHKLKPELLGKPQHELVALKSKGVEIQYPLEVPLVAFCGDTAKGDFFDLPHVRNAKVLVLECTFFEPDHVRRARAGYHLHAADLPGILSRLDNDAILLAHLTRRTGLRHAKQLLGKILPDETMAKIHFLMDRQRKVGSAPNAPQRQSSTRTPNREPSEK